MSPDQLSILTILIAVVAFLYSSVGHAGASGYIAGGAIAGIIFAIIAGALEGIESRFTELSATNPFVNGPYADLLSLLPFALLVTFLYFVARERILAPRKT